MPKHKQCAGSKAKELLLSVVGLTLTSWFISFSALTHISTTLLHLPAMSRTQRLSTFTRPATSKGTEPGRRRLMHE
jgi:hypothetical protein